jgi:signal transduction histidine kinase
MNFRLIRWQLPLSYAAIALLAALSLGAVLVATLRSYYSNRERLYLLENAPVIQSVLAPLLSSGVSPEVLAVQVRNLSVLTGTRVQLLDNRGELLADSGSPAGGDIITFSPLSFASAGSFEAPLGPELSGGMPVPAPPTGFEAGIFTQRLTERPAVSAVFLQEGLPQADMITATAPLTGTYGLITMFPATGPFSSFDERFISGTGEPRSNRLITWPLLDQSGHPLGRLHLSEGPAFGQVIVASVGKAWTVASLIAVLLAAGVGWTFSRRVTAPLSALSGVTQEMAAGNLSARASQGRPDEFGALARSFNEMAGRVEETVQTLRNFVSDAAHELQTPLTALRTDLELVSGEMDPARRTVVLERAQSQIERLSSLTQGLLDLSRLEAVRPAAGLLEAAGTVDLVLLLREASEAYAARAEQAGLAFTLELPDGESPVRGNEAQLRRAVGNLLDNAVKFTPLGGVIRVRLEAGEAQVHLQVRDSGIGIPPDDLPRLFGRFHRGRNTAGYPGSGLGLAIVRAIVHAHAGQVSAENLPGGGAGFTITLPGARPGPED